MFSVRKKIAVWIIVLLSFIIFVTFFWKSLPPALISLFFGKPAISYQLNTDMSLYHYDIRGRDSRGREVKTNLAIPKAYIRRYPKKSYLYKQVEGTPIPKKYLAGGYSTIYLETLLPNLQPKSLRYKKLLQETQQKYAKQMEKLEESNNKKGKDKLEITINSEVRTVLHPDSISLNIEPTGSQRTSVYSRWEREFSDAKRLGRIVKISPYNNELIEYAIKGRVYWYVPRKQSKFPLYITHNFNGNPDYKLVGTCSLESQYSELIRYLVHFDCRRINEYETFNTKVKQLILSFIVNQQSIAAK